MFFKALRIENYRGISHASFDDLTGTVIVAGPNGCGKSCVLDAIRLLKSAYGGYRPNEVDSFFGEFQINLHRERGELLRIFQDREKPLKIEADIVLAESETQFLKENGRQMVEEQAWRTFNPAIDEWGNRRLLPLASEQRMNEPQVQENVAIEFPELEAELCKPVHRAALEISKDTSSTTAVSRVLELVFGTYHPDKMGVIDYHGASRNYQRENLGSVQLDVRSNDDRMRNHALYDYSNKYSNLKTQMASEFIRSLLSGQQPDEGKRADDLVQTLRQLFQLFIPGKEFMGPRPNQSGGLDFPVRTASGSIHDIDELSSGEKELLYGYLRLRNSTPQNSVVLIDEPELHLNPRLMSGLAGFYHDHIGRARNNQIWLVSHSDALIRDALGKDGISIFHMQSTSGADESGQVSRVRVSEDLDRIVVDLVGDMAAYRPEAKIVIVEGGGHSEFDVKVIRDLFPRFVERVNLISGGNKRRVRDLYDTLNEVRTLAQIPGRFYSIVDRDDPNSASIESAEDAENLTRRTWDAYHIENYLLSDLHILETMRDALREKCLLKDKDSVCAALITAARETIPALLVHQIRIHANSLLLPVVELSLDPNCKDVAKTVFDAVARVARKVETLRNGELNSSELDKLVAEKLELLETSVRNGDWRTEFRGRDILKRFVQSHCAGLKYEHFANLLIAKMKIDHFEPPGMVRVLRTIQDW